MSRLIFFFILDHCKDRRVTFISDEVKNGYFDLLANYAIIITILKVPSTVLE